MSDPTTGPTASDTLVIEVAAHLAARGYAHGLDMTIIEKAAAFARGLRGMTHA